MIIVSAATGQLISRLGRLRMFPLLGTAIAAIGYYLFSTMTPATEFTTVAVFMFVTGIGLGFINPVLSLSAQLAVDRTRIGVATTSVSVTRSLGAGVGVAVLGSVFTTTFANDLTSKLGPQASKYAGGARSVNEIRSLPPHIQQVVIHALSGSLTKMFLWTVPVIVVGFLIALTFPNPNLDEEGPAPQGTPKDSTATSDGPPGEETPTND